MVFSSLACTYDFVNQFVIRQRALFSLNKAISSNGKEILGNTEEHPVVDEVL